MADPLERVRGNVRRMVEQDAPETDIDDYLRSENITPAELRASRTAGFTPDEAEIANQPMGAGERYTRLAASYVPGSERIRAAIYATGPMDERVGGGSWGDRYDRALRIVRHRDDVAQADPDVIGGTAVRTAGLAATAVGTGGYSLLQPIMRGGAGMWQMIRESARIGAGTGAPVALANTRATDPVEQAGDVLQGTVGGGVVGGAIPPVLALPAAARNALTAVARVPFTGRQGERIPPQRQFVEDWQTALPNDPVPTSAVAENPSLQRTARGMAGSALGSPVRNELTAATEAVERGVERTVRGQGLPEPQDFGAEQQRFLRRQLTEHSRSSAELEGMDRAGLERVRGQGGLNPDETYPTQFGARYRLAESEPVEGYGTAASIRGNFMSRTDERLGGTTATARLINELGLEARASGQLPGWRDGDLDNPQLWEMLRARLGDDVAGLLHAEQARQSTNLANLTVPGLREQRTLVRRTLQELEASRPGATAAGDIAALQRLHGAMTDDLQRFMNTAGPGGSNAALGYLRSDRLYQQFVNDRQALRRIFGDNVTPDEAYRRLVAATQRNTVDSGLLHRYLRTVIEKGGDREQAVRMLVAPMMEDGLPGFLRAWDNLHPSARVMLGSSNRAVMDDLDRLARLGQRLAPYQRALQGPGGIDLSRTSNLTLAAALIYHLPSALAAAGGVHLAARFMTSPRYLRWLTQAPTYVQGGANSRVFQSYLSRLQAIAADDAEIGEAVMGAVGELLPQFNPIGPANALFAGESSATADKKALARAKQMQREGRNRDEIWRETGWGQNHEGKWFYEIDDRAFAARNTTSGSYGQTFSHPDLEAAYGDRITGMPVRPTGPFPGDGMYVPPMRKGDRPLMMLRENMRGPKRRGTALHETQHAIDELEGTRSAEGLSYFQRGDEIRGRNAERRQNMTPEERRATPPWATEDVPPHLINIPQSRPPGMMRLGGPMEDAEAGPVPAPQEDQQAALDRNLGPNAGRLAIGPQSIVGAVAGTGRALVDTVKGAARSFNRLLEYQPGTEDQEAPVEAFNLAGTAATGAMPASAVMTPGTVGMFVGRQWATNAARNGRPTALRVLDTAERMEARGASPERIQETTRRIIEANDPRLGQVRREPDGNWQVEIDDSRAVFDERPGAQRMGEAMQHDELFLGYPEMRNVQLRRPDTAGGYHSPGNPRFQVPAEIGVGQRSPDPRRTALHELQHEAQAIEGFPRGGSPQDFASDGPLRHMRKPGETPRQAYLRISGEHDAFATMDRADWTPAQRRAEPMRELDDPIVRYGHEGAEARPVDLDMASVRARMEAGETVTAIAEAEGVSLRTLRKRMRESGIPPQPHRSVPSERLTAQRSERDARIVTEREGGDPVNVIAERHGLRPTHVTQILHRQGRSDLVRTPPRNMGAAEADEVLRRYRAGETPQAIGQAMGRSSTAIQNLLHALEEPLTRQRGRQWAPPEKRVGKVGAGRRAEGPMDRRALGIERQARKLEDELRGQGLPPERIAAEMNRRFGGNATAADIESGTVWWRVSEGRGGRREDVEYREPR